LSADDVLQLTVSELMTDHLVTCHVDTNLPAVARLLARRGVHALVVVDGQRRPVGIVSDFDVLAGEWLGDDPKSFAMMRTVTAEVLMSSPIETIAPEAVAAEAAAQMRRLHLSRLLVCDADGEAIGVISASDLVSLLGRAGTPRDRVRDIMSQAILTCSRGTSLRAAARAMTERRSRSVIVVGDQGEVVGVLTGNDLLLLYEKGFRERQPDVQFANELKSTLVGAPTTWPAEAC